MNYFFFFNDTATTEIYTLSLHDALPICQGAPAGRLVLGRLCDHRDDPANRGRDLVRGGGPKCRRAGARRRLRQRQRQDRKSTRLNSSHANISYAVFCLKKKKTSTHVLTS